MALKENTLFGQVDKIDQSIQLIKDFEPEEGYYLAFSGGKDSIVLKHLADRSGVKYDAHYSVTTIDPPDLIYYIREHYPDVKWERPEKMFLNKLIEKGFPTRLNRWCCSHYKENTASNRVILTGVRGAESPRRSKRKYIETCYVDSSKRYIHPLFYWTDGDIWSYIMAHKMPYCNLYDKGYKRLGCLFCPLAIHSVRLKDAELYPKWEKKFKQAFNKLYDKKKEQGKKSIERWKNGDEMFKYWLYDNFGRAIKDEIIDDEENIFQ